jgi:glycosyltransferase involved in cell wall biosynthesis
MSSPSATRRLNVVVLIPVYNDWMSLRIQLRELGRVSLQLGIQPSIVVVNDGSNQPVPDNLLAEAPVGSLRGVEIVHLHLNLGHQSAIAVGLSEIYHRHQDEVLIVMDADGEDRAEDIERFLQAHHEHRDRIVVARRGRRSEGAWFRVMYAVYQLVFRLFAGSSLDYGNYCLIPRALLGRIAFNPMAWSHLAAAISRSGIEVVKVDADRGIRFFGSSSMSLQGLVSHGLSAVSVFLDLAMIRVVIFSSSVTAFAMVGVSVTVYLRLFTDLAIPGWATSAVGLLSIIGLQGLILSTIASFLVLRSRSGATTIPAVDASKFVAGVARIFGND